MRPLRIFLVMKDYMQSQRMGESGVIPKLGIHEEGKNHTMEDG